MDAKSFIIKKLKDLSTKYPLFTFTYWTEESMGNHFVEVNPSDFTQSAEFLDDEVDFVDEFYSIFLNDSLSFVSSEQLSMVQNIVLVETIFSQVAWLKLGSSNNNYMKNEKFNTDGFKQREVSPVYDYALAA